MSSTAPIAKARSGRVSAAVFQNETRPAEGRKVRKYRSGTLQASISKGNGVFENRPLGSFDPALIRHIIQAVQALPEGTRGTGKSGLVEAYKNTEFTSTTQEKPTTSVEVVCFYNSWTPEGKPVLARGRSFRIFAGEVPDTLAALHQIAVGLGANADSLPKVEISPQVLQGRAVYAHLKAHPQATREELDAACGEGASAYASTQVEAGRMVEPSMGVFALATA